jgi:hypothetical protein
MRTWEARDSDLGRPIAAPLELCAELLGVDLATIREAAAHVEPYVRVDGTRSGASCSLSANYAPKRSDGGGAATLTVDALLQQAAARADVRRGFGARPVIDANLSSSASLAAADRERLC